MPAARFRAPTIAIALLAGVFLTLHGLNRVTFDLLVFRIGEQTVWTWLTSTLFFAASVVVVAFVVLRRPPARWPWIALAVLMSALSLDEVAALHERVESEGGSDLSFFVLQPLTAGAAVILFLGIRRALDRAERLWVALAAGALVVAQIGSTLAAEVDLPHVLHEGWTIAEELLEMLVPALVLAATLPTVWRHLAPALRGGPASGAAGNDA